VRTAFLIAGAFLLSCLAWYATTLPRLPTGFAGRYYAASDQSSRPTLTTSDDRISRSIVRRDWPLANEPFTARWDAYLILNRSGQYRFSLLSDGGSWVYVDDRLAVDNGGPHGPRQVTVEIPLGRGVHAVRVEYSSPADSYGVDLLWSSAATGRLSPLTGLAVSPRPPSRSEVVLRGAIAMTRTLVVIAWTVAYLYVLVTRVAAPAMGKLTRHHLRGGVPAPVFGLVAVTAAVYAVAITWGVPGQGWAPDEVIPPDFFDAFDRHFSHGWWSKYPPAHFYVCSVATAPLLAWRWLDPTGFGASSAPEVVWIIFRAINVSMGAATVAIVYLCGSYLYGAWSAFVAAAIAALTMPAVYYAKVANLDVPYVFWFAISLVSFVRILVDESPIDYLVFAVAAALAVCTKDQAYGLYGLPVLAIACLAYIRARGSSPLQRVVAMIRQRHVWLAIVAGLATFVLCDNLLFNTDGFNAHVRYITGGGSTAFRMFDSSVGGQWQLWRAAWMLARVSVGWPAFVLCVAGLAMSLWRPGASQMRLWWLLLPIASYYLTFLAPIGFTYDRFLMPMFLGLALAGGLCAARLDRAAPPLRTWLRAGIGGALAYTFAYVIAIDAAMLRDSRYAVERWIRSHALPGSTIGRIGPIEHVPRLEEFFTVLVEPTADGIRSTSLDYIVVNADWVERFGPGRPEYDGYRRLREGQLGYHQVFEARTPIRVFGMSLEDRFESFGSTRYSTLARLNPPTLVFKRDAVGPGIPVPTARTP
jgi:PA14 domain/Dolichyl-phosphate-mannose-protein mannosyltransferase